MVPEKTYTSNPFVDNVIYYAKWLAMNCSVKDEEEALNNETKETLEAGDILISCIESSSIYEMFKKIPQEILEKYIPVHSNLDLYVENTESLKIHLDHYDIYTRTEILDNLSRIAREVYIDHYDIITNYVDALNPTWIEDNLELYNNCVSGLATYEDLFNELPNYTTKRILKTYLNNYDSSDLDNISSSLSNFTDYIDSRTDSQINSELDNISKAMRDVFIDHYRTMQDRGYFRQANDTWLTFIDNMDAYNRCKRGESSYLELYELFPDTILRQELESVFGADTVNTYRLAEGLENLEMYFNTITNTPAEDKVSLNTRLQDIYLANYNCFMNYSVYGACIDGQPSYFDLIEYLPKETLKMILNTQIDEVTNLQIYEDNKLMLDNYLQTLPATERANIIDSINKDMRQWYPENHKEYNNYYRSLIGLPPVGSDKEMFEDTLFHTWDDKTKSFKEFGNRFIKRLPTTIYPEIHWKQNIYEFDSYDIGILNEYGVLEDYLAACGSSMSDPRYRYIRYLGDNKLNLYQCRRALKFQLIGIPTVDDPDAQKRFVDAYAVNRDYVLRTVYSDAHKFQSDYYDKFMIIFILINTIMDMLSGITQMIIDREVFDSRCIKWLFESFGVPYYSEIPIRYLRSMLKNLNTLLKYKSSTKNMIDICKLFGFSDVRVFGYYLFKERQVDSYNGDFIIEDHNEINYDLSNLWVMDDSGDVTDYNGIRYSQITKYDNYRDLYMKKIYYEDDNGYVRTKHIIDNAANVYVKDPEYDDFIRLKDTQYFKAIKANTSASELKFIKVPIDSLVTEYKNNPDYIIEYDEITYNDEGNTWDGGLLHEDLYYDLLDHNFNAVKSKYVSVETVTDLTEQAFQVSYFYNMLFDNLYSEDALTVKIPYIKLDRDFRFMDVICYLFALMYFYNGLEDTIMYSPTQILYVKGYNFNDALNAVLDDPTAFTQEENQALRTNIFDINERIAVDNYNYRDAFSDYGIKSFNLEADVDALEEWLNKNYQMSLNDFIVDDSLTNFGQVITLRQFFSLRNSYYQKDMFVDNISPLPYNQNIKSAYGIELYEKQYLDDTDGFTHEFIYDNEFMEVINYTNDEIFIIDYNTIIKSANNEYHTLYLKYVKQSNGNFNLADNQYYYYNSNTECIERLFDNNIYVLDNNNRYIFATDTIYSKDAETNEYVPVTDERYFVTDRYEPDRKCLVFGEYWIKNSLGEWVLDPSKVYVLVSINGVSSYMLWETARNHQNITIAENDYWIKHSDGHFVKYSETDYYITGHGNDTIRYRDRENIIYELQPEDCYVEVSRITDEYDIDLNGTKRYFKKIDDFYRENNWLFNNNFYIYDNISQTYIPESDLLSPANCYYYTGNGYNLIINNYYEYESYSSFNIKPRTLLVLQENNNYDKFGKYLDNYVLDNNPNKQYIYNSDTDYITAIINDSIYSDNHALVVIFNKEITKSDVREIEYPGRYNPEVTDNVWDENDWFYNDESYAEEDIGMNGENIWYYTKPGTIRTDTDDVDIDPVGSGFYLSSDAYIGSARLEAGKKYYMAFDIETNFTGRIQIYNTADSSVNNPTDRLYEVKRKEKQHVAQTFVANDIETPEIRLLIYDFENFPITPGDYIIISNIRFVCAYSDNFISQDIPSYDKLQELYRTNEAIYKYLRTLMAQESDFTKYNIYKKLYDSLMISKYNKEAFKIGDNKYAKTYTEFLETRDAVLHSKLSRFKSLDVDTMHKEIADEIIEITYAIDSCIDTYNYGFLYSYFPAVSANYIQQYITKIINWFKSWKVHLLGINTIYKIGSGPDDTDNLIKILEDKRQKNKFNHEKINVHIHGTAKINPIDATNASGIPYAELYDMNEYTNEYEAECNPKDRVRLIARTANRIEYHDSKTELHLIFNDDEIIAGSDDNELVVISNNAGFRSENENDFIMSTEENEQQAFAHQVIDEINKYSGDYIDWRALLDE